MYSLRSKLFVLVLPQKKLFVLVTIWTVEGYFFDHIFVKNFELLTTVTYTTFDGVSKYVNFISKNLKILCLNSHQTLVSLTLEFRIKPNKLKRRE